MKLEYNIPGEGISLNAIMVPLPLLFSLPCFLHNRNFFSFATAIVDVANIFMEISIFGL